MTDKALEEWLFKQGFHPLPFVRFTERPDNSSSSFTRRSYFDDCGHITFRYYCSYDFISSFTACRRISGKPHHWNLSKMDSFLGVFLSLLLLPFWYLLSKHPELLPKTLDFFGPKEFGEIPLLLQIIIADVGIEFMRLAAIHTPTPLSTAMGIVAALVIGQMAVDVGLFIPEVVLYTAITAIFTFAIPSYELSIATKIF